MTVIIKSDKKATASLGNVNGIKGPQDWSMFFDFENEIYSTKTGGVLKQNYALSDVVEATRQNLNGAPISINKSGVERAITSNAEIRTALLKNGRFGVLAEDVNENFFLNSSAPASQSISLAAAATRIVVSCEGSGSITVSGDVVGAGAVVTKDTPRVFDRISASAVCNLNLVVSGSLTHAQVELATGSQTGTSKIKTGSASVIRPRELVKVKQSLLNSIIQNKSAITVLVQTIDYNPVVNPTMNSTVRFGLESGQSLKLMRGAGILANLNLNDYVLQYIDATSTSSAQIQAGVFSASNRFSVFNQATALNDGSVLSAFNGVQGNPLSIVNPFPVADIVFGFGYSSPIARNGLRGIVTKLIVYDRVLTQAEITELTRSWN